MQIQKMTTLKKISHLTGFSVSTISKALNNKHDINVDTRKIIQEFALKTNYKPNKNALALRRSKSNSIAVILPQINDAFYGDVLFNIQKTASTMGYRIMLFQSFEEASKVAEYLDEINDGSVDGAIVLSAKATEERENNYKSGNFPVEYIQILKSQPESVTKAKCISNFDKLIKQIN